MKEDKEGIQLGGTLEDLGEIKGYYIERTIERRIKVKIECLWSDTSDIFAIEDVDEETVSKWRLKSLNHIDIVMFNNIKDDFIPPARIVLFDELNAANFDKLCKFYPERIIHWVERQENGLLWKKSYGSLSHLRHYIDNEHTSSSLIPREINDIGDNLVIIAAEPGMGKSTVLTYLANQTKDSHPSMWIVKINLLDHTLIVHHTSFVESGGNNKETKINLVNNKVAKINLVNNKETAVAFLFDLLKLETLFERELFKRFYDKMGRMAILLDGFDEMTPEYKDKVIQLLKHLIDANVKLWVTTRTYMREQLEDGLSTIAHVLSPFTPTDQETFLKKLWSKHANNRNVQVFIDKILTILSKLIQDNEDQFKGVPLQMKMIAEIFEKYLNDESPNLPEILDIKQLYDEFNERKWTIYAEEKLKADLTNPAVMKENERMKKDFTNRHMLAALKTLFTDDDCKVLLSDEQVKEVEKFIKDIKEGDEKTGIINRVVNGKPEFIHRTFAEYFAALYFETYFRIEAAKNLLSRNLFEDNNKVMRHFFDRALAKNRALTKDEPDSIHIAVLDRDKDKIVNFLNTPGIAMQKDKAGRTGLHLAAAYGYRDIAILWLQETNDVLSQKDDLFGWSAICYAGKTKHWDIADLLIASGAAVSHMVEAIKDETKDNETEEMLIHLAARHNHIHLAGALIEANVNIVNVRDKNNLNRTPLHLAAKHKHVAMVKLLVENKANVKAADDDGSTSVHEAAFGGNLELLEYLIGPDSTISLEDTDIYGRTPLYRAAENNNLETIKFLLSKGVNVNNDSAFPSFGERRKWTALHVAAAKGRVDIFNLLIENGAKPDVRDGNGHTPLDIAAHAGHLNHLQGMGATDEHRLHVYASLGRLDDMTNIMVDMNSDQTNRLLSSFIYGWTPLHRAAMNDHVLIIKFLLENGVDINIKTKSGFTPLMAVAAYGRLGALQYLIGNNADLKATNELGCTALHVAAEHGHLEKFRLLKDKLISMSDFDIDILDFLGGTPLLSAAYAGKLEMVKYLVENGAKLNASDEFGGTLLMAAALSNSQDVMKYFLKQTDIRLAIGQQTCDFVDKNGIYGKLGLTPLHAAVAYDAIDIVKILVEECKIDVNVGRGISVTPLHSAALFNSTKSTQYLSEKMADMDVDVNLETIFQLCTEALGILKSAPGRDIVNSVLHVVSEIRTFCTGFTINITAPFISRVMNYDNLIFSQRQLFTPDFIKNLTQLLALYINPNLIQALIPILTPDLIFELIRMSPELKQQLSLLKATVERVKLGKQQPTDNQPFMIW